MPTQQIKGAVLHYEQSGSGPLLVLLHAFPVDARMWSAQLDELGTRFRVIAPDFRGFGKSTNAGAFTVPSMAENIHDFLAAIAPSTGVVLGGLSMGGYVAMNYARKFPGDLRGLILADTRDAGDSAEKRENRNRLIEVARSKGSAAVTDLLIGKMLTPDAETRRPATVNALRSMMEACPARTIEYALAALRDRPDMTEELSKISVPTLIVVGDADALTPPAMAQQMQKRIAGSQLAMIPGAGHMSAMEQPSLFNRAVRAFMDGIA